MRIYQDKEIKTDKTDEISLRLFLKLKVYIVSAGKNASIVGIALLGTTEDRIAY
jgi:hypothetical protein